jgi:hypothetical protein
MNRRRRADRPGAGIPGRNIPTHEADDLPLPGPERYLHGRPDHRIALLSQLLPHKDGLPRIGAAGLEAAGCDVDQLEHELRQLGARLRRGYQGMRPRGLAGDGVAERRAAIDLAAAAPLIAAVISRLAELDAAAVILRTPDPDVLDSALAAVLSEWSARGVPSASAPPLRRLAGGALATQRVALLAFAASPGAEDEAVWRALAGLWDATAALFHDDRTPPRNPLAGLVAVAASPELIGLLAEAAIALVALRNEAAQRRAAARALGAELDRRGGAGAAAAEVALVIAHRAREAVALGDALVSYLRESVRAASEPEIAERIQPHATRWRDLIAAVSTRMRRTLDAADRLTGMEV